MAESKKPRAPAAPPRVTDPGSQLEELNDQLGRFLQHADQLVEEWARFGADVRRTVDGEVGRIDQAVIDAVDRAARDINAQVDRVAAERVERAIDQGMHKLRAELERGGGRVGVGGGGTSAASAHAATAAAADKLRLVLGAVIAANFLLVVLVVMVWRSDPAPAPAAVAPGPGSATVAPAVLDACVALAGGEWSLEAAERVIAAGTSACGDDEAAVRALLHERLDPPAPAAIDAGIVDAAPPVDAKAPKKNR